MVKKSKYTFTFNDENYVNMCSCSCKYFLKHAVCMHLVAFSNFNNLDLFGNRYSRWKDEVLENFLIIIFFLNFFLK